jgi:hypothetical protein
MTRATEWAAGKLYHADPMQTAMGRYGVFPYDLFFSFVLQLVASLAQCQPRSTAGYDYLTWRPGWLSWLLGRSRSDLSAYRAKVEALIAVEWTQGREAFRAFAESLWQLVDGGEFTPERVRDLYADVRGS